MGESLKEFVFLSGLPRAGSTLLSSILNQNPLIYSEGNSAVCQLMWDVKQSCENQSWEQLAANGRLQTKTDLLKSIPNIYYKDIDNKIIIDKCRSWTLEDNVSLIKNYICSDPKIIVLTRPIDEIAKSFIKLGEKNNIAFKSEELLAPGSDPIMRSLDGVHWAKSSNSGEFLFIEYKDLVVRTEEIISSIYSFCGWSYFQHDFLNIVNNNPEDDSVYGLAGMHDIRSIPSFR